MPTYEYRCANGHKFERIQKMNDPPVDTCPDCGASAERLLSRGGGLLFKGSGFYTTDYRSDKYRKAAESDKPSEKPATGTTSSEAGKSGPDTSGGGGSSTSGGGGSSTSGGGGSSASGGGGSSTSDGGSAVS
jgi:putative FmdB family regulatory protein